MKAVFYVVVDVELEKDCCGFYNALDYCCVSQVSHSIPKFIEEYTVWLKSSAQEKDDGEYDYGFESTFVIPNNFSDYTSSILDETYVAYHPYAVHDKNYETEPLQACDDKNEFCVCEKLSETGQEKVRKLLRL